MWAPNTLNSQNVCLRNYTMLERGSSCAFNKESLSITIIWTHNYCFKLWPEWAKSARSMGLIRAESGAAYMHRHFIIMGGERPLLAQEACCILQIYINATQHKSSYCPKTQLVFGPARLGFRFKCCFCQRRIYMSICVCKCSPCRFWDIWDAHAKSICGKCIYDLLFWYEKHF